MDDKPRATLDDLRIVNWVDGDGNPSDGLIKPHALTQAEIDVLLYKDSPTLGNIIEGMYVWIEFTPFRWGLAVTTYAGVLSIRIGPFRIGIGSVNL